MQPSLQVSPSSQFSLITALHLCAPSPWASLPFYNRKAPPSSLSVPSPPPRSLLPGQPSLELVLCSFPPHVRHNQEPGLTSLGPLSIFRPLPFLPCECLENPSPLLVVPAILPPPPAGVNAGPLCPPQSEHLDHWLCTASPPTVRMSLLVLAPNPSAVILGSPHPST